MIYILCILMFYCDGIPSAAKAFSPPHDVEKKLLAPTWRRKLFGARQGLPRLDQAPDQQHSNPLRRGTRYTDRCNLVHFPLFQAGFPTSPWEKVARVIGADSVSSYSVTWECSSISFMWIHIQQTFSGEQSFGHGSWGIPGAIPGPVLYQGVHTPYICDLYKIPWLPGSAYNFQPRLSLLPTPRIAKPQSRPFLISPSSCPWY